jgi:hypothetical protein
MTASYWVLLAVAGAVVVGVVIGVVVRRSRPVPAAVQDHAVTTWCVAHGHAYRIHDTGWRCATCGNFVARHEGELYGLVEEGRVERRREARIPQVTAASPALTRPTRVPTRVPTPAPSPARAHAYRGLHVRHS